MLSVVARLSLLFGTYTLMERWSSRVDHLQNPNRTNVICLPLM